MSELADELREWARGSYGLEAGVELLLRAFDGRFARRGYPWVKDDDGCHWIDFEAIPNGSGALSGGERRILLIASSLGADEPVVLGDVLAGLDRMNLGLVLAAVSHAAGAHQDVEFLPLRDGKGIDVIAPSAPRIELGPAHPWPDEAQDIGIDW